VNGLWPWATLAALGAFHGLNPAMGWLFAVALGLHRGSRVVVLWALAPIALGHAVSIWLVAVSAVVLGNLIDLGALRVAAGALLILWAIYHFLYGHRHRVRVGMTAGFAGLAMWSFLMAGAHGAGLMLVPALLRICTVHPQIGQGSVLISLAAVGVHSAAMLAVTGAVSVIVYEWVGVNFLRRAWINFDAVWTIVLVGVGAVLLAGYPS
jgi:hypothetical protein